jgi:NAD(P)-dependent dehydrogenase (short-subunit alcohol dehydrogenase family)
MKKSTSTYALSMLATTLAAAAAYALVPPSSRVRRGQVAIITGGSRGLGLALAHRFARAGCKLVLAARSADELELARDQILRSRDLTNEDDVLLVVADLNDPEQCQGLIASAINTFGQLDLLINNAGIIEVGPVEDQPLAAYERAMQTNFFAALYTSQAALPHLLARRAGSIVNIASIGGKLAVPHMLPYSAAKFALVGYSEGLHAELRHKGIRVTTVCPGLMRTAGEDHAKFLGQSGKEKAWFDFAAKTPFIAASAAHAANRIFNAVNAGRAEITITPQAWLAARFHGLCPETTQILAALANEYVLPAPGPADRATSYTHLHEVDPSTEPFADPSPS